MEYYRDRNWLYNKYWNEKCSAPEIANLCGCGHTTVLTWMDKFNIERRLPSVVTNSNKSYRDETWLRQKYLEENLSSRDIAKMCGCGKSAILKWMNIFDIQRRSTSEACKGRKLSLKTREKISNTLHLKMGNHCNLSDKALEWIEGELLGDGSLTMRSKYSARFNYTSKYIEYADYVSHSLEMFGIKRSGKIIKYKNNQHGAIIFCYRSRDYAELLPLRKKWYPEGKKIVPKDIKLTRLVSRQWYIGDGGLYNAKQSNPYIGLATCGFTIKEVELLRYRLDSLGFKNTRNKSNNTIRISAYSVKDFLKYIGSCPVTCYQYKWSVST